MTVVWVPRRMGLVSYKPKFTFILDLLYDDATIVPKSKEDYSFMMVKR